MKETTTQERKLIIEPTFKQHQAWEILHDDITEEFLFGGGAGGGKTYIGCEWLIEMCLRYPMTRWFIARKRLKVLKQTTLVSFYKIARKHGLKKDVDFKYNDQTSQITFIATESTIDLLEVDYRPSDPDYEDLGSAEYTGGWIEEGGEVHEGAYDTLSVRVGRYNNELYGLLGKLFITCNPKKNWLYRIFYLPWKKHTLPDNMRFLQSLVTDNPKIDAGYIQKLKNLKNKAKRERLLKGNWEYEDDPATLIEFENIADLFTNTLDDEDLEGKYITVDVARYGDDLTVIKCWQGLKVYRVRVRSKQSIPQTIQLAKETAKEEGVPFSHVVVDEDGVGGGVVDGMQGVRGFVANSSPLEDTRVNPNPDEKPNYRSLKAQCGYMLADYANEHRIAIDLNGPVDYDEDINYEEMLTEELEQLKAADVDADDAKLDLMPKEDVKAAIGRSPDFGDNMIMRMIFFLKPKKVVSTTVIVRPPWKGYNRR